MTIAYNTMSDDYMREIDEGVNSLVAVSENIRSQIVKNEYAIAHLSKEMAGINDKIQTSTDNYNNYQAELNDALDRYNDLCNILAMLNQQMPTGRIFKGRHKRAVTDKEELCGQIKALSEYIDNLKKTYGSAYIRKDINAVSDKDYGENIRKQIDMAKDENKQLVSEYHNLMKGADVDIEEKLRIKAQKLRILESNMRNEYKDSFNRYEFEDIKKKVDKMLDIEDGQDKARRRSR